MKKHLPVFPLSIVAFPREQLHLHIFEPRYRQLIKECDETGTTFGIPTVLGGKLQDFGTEMRLTNIERVYPNGEMDVRTEGVQTFKIIDFYDLAQGKLYAAADVEILDADTNGYHMTNQEIVRHVRELFQIMNVMKSLPSDLQDFVTYDVAHHVGFSVEQEYEFLCLPTEGDRQEFMLEHLEHILPTVREMERLRERALLNGHFKYIVPPNV
jgi:ATP-dependent Lon protease